MSTVLAERPANQDQLVITVTPKTVQEITQEFLSLKINGIEDTAGRERVVSALKRVVKLRTTAEKERVAVKANALEECKRIDKRWKDLFALIEPIENHLESQEASIKAIENRIEQERIHQIKLTRQESLTNIGFNPMDFIGQVDFSQLGSWSDDQFNKFRMQAAEMVAKKKKADEDAAAESARRQAEREANQAESDRLAAEQARLDSERAEFDRKQREAAAAEFARRQEEEKQRLEQERKALIESLKPDRERLQSVINQLGAIQIPAVGQPAVYARTQIENALGLAYTTIEKILKGME